MSEQQRDLFGNKGVPPPLRGKRGRPKGSKGREVVVVCAREGCHKSFTAHTTTALYCSPACRAPRKVNNPAYNPVVFECDFCERSGTKKGDSFITCKGTTICPTCAGKLRPLTLTQMVRHGLGRDHVKQALARHYCWVCNKPFKRSAEIDHDHAHCSGAHGCAECFVGFTHPNCNHARGDLNDDAENMQALTDYQRGWDKSKAERGILW
jgi:hypothetical protein